MEKKITLVEKGLLTKKKSSVKNVSLGEQNESDYFQVKTKCFFPGGKKFFFLSAERNPKCCKRKNLNSK